MQKAVCLEIYRVFFWMVAAMTMKISERRKMYSLYYGVINIHFTFAVKLSFILAVPWWLRASSVGSPLTCWISSCYPTIKWFIDYLGQADIFSCAWFMLVYIFSITLFTLHIRMCTSVHNESVAITLVQLLFPIMSFSATSPSSNRLLCPSYIYQKVNKCQNKSIYYHEQDVVPFLTIFI